MIINNIANTNMRKLLTMNGRTQTSGTITTISVMRRRRRRRRRRKNQVRQMIIQNPKKKYQQAGNLLMANQMRRRLPSEFSKQMNLGLYNKLALESPRS